MVATMARKLASFANGRVEDHGKGNWIYVKIILYLKTVYFCV